MVHSAKDLNILEARWLAQTMSQSIKLFNILGARGRHDNDKVDKRYDKNDIFIIFMINDKLIFLVFLDDKSDKW